MKIGDVVWIRFYDHTKASREVSIHRIFGRISDKDDLQVVVKTWECLSDIEEKESSDNNEYVSIIRSAIIDYKKWDGA